MADKKTVWEFDGNSKNLVKALQNIDAALGTVSKASAKTDKALDVTQRKIKSGVPVSQKLSQAMGGLGQASQAAGGKIGETAGRVGALSSAIGAMANPVGIAVAAVAGFTVGLAAVTGAMVASVFAADDLIDELQALENLEGFEPVSPEALAAIQLANDSVTALGAVFKQLVVTLGASVAPTVAAIAEGFLRFSLVAMDSFQAFAEGKNLLADFANFLITELVQAMLYPLDVLYKFIGGLGDLAEMLGMDGIAASLKDAEAGWEGLTGHIAGFVTSGIADAATVAFKGLGLSTAEMDDRIEALLESMPAFRGELEAQANVADATKEKIEDVAKAYDKLMESSKRAGEKGLALAEKVLLRGVSAAEQRAFAFIKEQAALQKTINAQEEYIAGLREAILLESQSSQNTEALADLKSRLAEAERELAVTQAAHNQSLADSEAPIDTQTKQFDKFKEVAQAVATTLGQTSDMFASLYDGMTKDAENMTDEQRRQAKGMFAAMKATGIAEVAINTAIGVSSAWKTPIAAPFIIPGIIASGVAQTAMIAAQQPAFHTGGIIPTGEGGRMINALPGESVLTRETTSRLGPDGVAALNSGVGSQPMVIEQVYGHRVFDRFVVDNIQKGGPLRNAISSGRRVGHRRV